MGVEIGYREGQRAAPGQWRRIAGGVRRAALAALLLAAGCQTQPNNFGKPDDMVDPAAGSQANIGSLSAVIAQKPNDANGYNVRGTAYGRAGKLREAITDFDTSLKLNPSFYQAYANRALVQRKLGHDDLALADYNKAIEINQGYAVAYVGRGNLYRESNRLDQALADFNHAITLDANDPRAFHNRGLIYQAKGQHPQAIDDFSKAISLAPGNAEPFEGRGLSYLATGDYKAALEDFNEAVKRDKESYAAWADQGLALEKLGMRDKAFAAFAHASSLNPTYAPAVAGMRRTSGPAQRTT